MPRIKINNERISLEIAADGSDLIISNGLCQYAPGADWATIWYGNLIKLNLVRNGRVTIIPHENELQINIDNLQWRARFAGNQFYKPDPGPDLQFVFKIRLERDEVIFTSEVPQNLDDESIVLDFPGKILQWDTRQANQLLATLRSHGVRFNFPCAEKEMVEVAEFVPLVGLSQKSGQLGVCCTTPADHTVVVAANQSSAEGVCYFKQEFQQGKSEYARTVRLKFFPPGSDHVALAKWYRDLVKREKRFVTLQEKIAAHPEVGQLAGSIIWKHNVYYQAQLPPEVTRDWSYYVFSAAHAAPEGQVGNWTAREIFDTAAQKGFDRICLFNTGWNNQGYDRGYPKRLPLNPERGTAEDFRRSTEYGRALSEDYICSVHDNYRDFYPSSPEFNTQDLIYTADQIPLKGGIWRGGRCYIGCCQATISYARRDLPQIASLTDRGAIYIDVLGQSNLQNCYNPRHPGGKRQDIAARIKILQLAKNYFGAVATEGTPFDWAVPYADIGAFAQLRAYDFWHAQAIPLFPLIYHDCIYNYVSCDLCGFYGSHYSNMVALNCMLPYGFDDASYRISHELRDSFTAEMTDHKFITPEIEQTFFSNGISVIANNSSESYLQVPPGNFRIVKS